MLQCKIKIFSGNIQAPLHTLFHLTIFKSAQSKLELFISDRLLQSILTHFLVLRFKIFLSKSRENINFNCRINLAFPAKFFENFCHARASKSRRTSICPNCKIASSRRRSGESGSPEIVEEMLLGATVQQPLDEMDINMAEGMRHIVSAPKMLWLDMIGHTKARPYRRMGSRGER